MNSKPAWIKLLKRTQRQMLGAQLLTNLRRPVWISAILVLGIGAIHRFAANLDPFWALLVGSLPLLAALGLALISHARSGEPGLHNAARHLDRRLGNDDRLCVALDIHRTDMHTPASTLLLAQVQEQSPIWQRQLEGSWLYPQPPVQWLAPLLGIVGVLLLLGPGANTAQDQQTSLHARQEPHQEPTESPAQRDEDLAAALQLALLQPRPQLPASEQGDNGHKTDDPAVNTPSAASSASSEQASPIQDKASPRPLSKSGTDTPKAIPDTEQATLPEDPGNAITGKGSKTGGDSVGSTKGENRREATADRQETATEWSRVDGPEATSTSAAGELLPEGIALKTTPQLHDPKTTPILSTPLQAPSQSGRYRRTTERMLISRYLQLSTPSQASHEPAQRQ